MYTLNYYCKARLFLITKMLYEIGEKLRMFKKRDKAKSKELLISAAIVVFAKHGYERATYKNIAVVAGLNESLITRYFGGKKGLLIAAMESIREEFYAVLDVAEHKQSFSEEIHHAAHILAGMYEKNMNNFLTFFMLIPNDNNNEYLLISKDRREFVLKFNSSLFQQFQDNGEIPAGVDLEQLYKRLVMLLHSTLYFAFIVLKLPIKEVEELLHYHIDIFIKGLNFTNN